ncbi:NAD(P)H-flavin reductase [Paraglaciecola aestuariivivens]
MQSTPSKVETIEPLTDTVKRIVLRPSTPLTFIAGQYVQVVMGENDKRPFSIANAPSEDGAIELHIGAEPGNQYAGEVIEKMQQAGQVELEGGLGEAFLQGDLEKPIILLAGGTGFSYTYSILQQLLAQGLKHPVYLYWGTRTIEDMYALPQLTELEKQHPLFHFVPVLEFPPVNWPGKTGWVHQAVINDKHNFADFDLYVAGRFDMAKTVREEFCKLGLDKTSLYGDAFAFI